MNTPEETKRDMAKCAKRVSEVIECFCEAGELVECADDARYELIGGISCIRQLEQEIKQKDERIRKLEREREAMLRDMKAWPACDACKHRNLLCTQKPCSECREAGNGKTVMWEWRGVEEENHAED